MLLSTYGIGYSIHVYIQIIPISTSVILFAEQNMYTCPNIFWNDVRRFEMTIQCARQIKLNRKNRKRPDQPWNTQSAMMGPARV